MEQNLTPELLNYITEYLNQEIAEYSLITSADITNAIEAYHESMVKIL